MLDEQRNRVHSGGGLRSSQSAIKDELVNVLSLEASSIQSLISNFPSNAEELVNKIVTLKGKVVFSGSGKSGHVARKLTATFSSLGTASHFLHPHDALHGDLGCIQPNDLVIIFSKSASGAEFENILSFLQTQQTESVLICCDQGPLTSKANFVVYLPFQREACALNLAPTSSSTLMLAFGDAIAVATSKARSFSKNDFARNHPAGALGKQLLMKVSSFMYSIASLPLLSPEDSFIRSLEHITEKKLGVGIIVDDNNKLLGIISDGDIRRHCLQHEAGVFTKTATDVMTKKVKTINANMFAGDALAYMEDFNITSLVVTDTEQRVVGLVHIHDIVKAGLRG